MLPTRASWSSLGAWGSVPSGSPPPAGMPCRGSPTRRPTGPPAYVHVQSSVPAGSSLTPWQLEGLHLGSFTRVRDNLDELCRRVDVNRPAQMLPNYGVMSVHELVVSHGATPPVQALAAAWTRAIFGLSSRDVGALPFLLHCKCAGGLSQAISDAGARGPWRLSGGTAQLMAELASRLLPGTLWLSHEVEAVDQTSGSVCVVTTALGAVVRCSNVVVACSASHCRDIAFAPELSEDKQWLHGADPGFVSAVRLVYDEPWWRERGLSGRGIGLDGPVALVTDTSRDSAEEGYSLTCLVAGEPGRELYRLPESDRHARVVRHAEAILGGSSPTPCGVAELGQGAGCLAVPARGLGSLERDQWRPEGAVFFAGADTSLASRGHMEGALAASARATDHILRAARPSTELAARL